MSADPPLVQAAFRAGLGAQWTFLSDEQRTIIKQINILDETEGEYAYRAQPYTFVLRPDLRIHAIYSGWYFVGRPTNEELRHDLRAIMESRSDYHYEAYDTPEVRNPHSTARMGRWHASTRRTWSANSTRRDQLVRSQCRHWYDRTRGDR